MVRSVAQRVRNKFAVAVAEVDRLDARQMATFGVVCVANERSHCESVLNEVLDYVSDSRLDAELIDVEFDLLKPFELARHRGGAFPRRTTRGWLR